MSEQARGDLAADRSQSDQTDPDAGHIPHPAILTAAAPAPGLRWYPPAVMAAAAEVLRAITVHADPARAVAEKRYLKSDLQFLGASVPKVRAALRGVVRERPGLDRAGVRGLATELWGSPLWEMRLAAVELLAHRVGLLTSADFDLIESLIRQSLTWALVDPLSTNVAGRIVERDPAGTGPWLDRWATDPDFWVRRASLLSLLPGLRRGAGDFDRFGRYADPMLEEREFFIRKAIGWILRETGKRRPELVRGWLGPRAGRASGLTIREAAKYLPGREL